MNVYIVPTLAIPRGFDKRVVSSWVGTAESLSLLPTLDSGILEPSGEAVSVLQVSGALWLLGEQSHRWLHTHNLRKAPVWLHKALGLQWKSRPEHSNSVAGKDFGAGFSKL